MTWEFNRKVKSMRNETNDQRLFRAKNVALWALQILTAAVFFFAGVGALSGQPMMVETFDKIGIGQWFRYVTGGIEVTSAVLLLIPRLTPVGAALLVCTMIGAVLTHLMLGGSPVPALVLGCFAAIILAGRFGTLRASVDNRRAPATRASKPETAAAGLSQAR